MIKYLIVLALLGSFLIVGARQEAAAQVAGRNFGIGGQIGDPSGLALKWYRGGGGSFNFAAWDFLLAWDFDEGDNDALFLNVHGLFERPLSDVPLNFYYGPGVFLGMIERPGEDSVYLGISGNFGINYFFDRLEVFLQLTPRLSLAPNTDGNLGGGLGARFYL